MASEIVRWLDHFQDVPIAVVGDLILDEFLWGDVERISPEAPVPIIEIARESYRLGAAANVALSLVSLGARPLLVGVIGDDPAGKLFLEEMEEQGLEPGGIVIDPERRTTMKTRIIAHRQQVCRADRESKTPLSPESREQVLARASEMMQEASALILSDYAKGVLDEELCQSLIRQGRKSGIFTAADPKPANFHHYRGASVVTPNLKEAEKVGGFQAETEEQLVELGSGLAGVFRMENVLITRGAEGMSLFEPTAVTHLPTAAREVFDVTGAGDTVIAVLTLAAAAGASLTEAADLANHAAGVVVGKVGTATVTPVELRRSLEE